ncbi:MAG: MinD/ParA family protein [Bacillota bacterium]|nr:MinD/ParA family protein [Bacillota bacterium]
MKDQAEKLRDMVNNQKGLSRIIAVTSGKGGVGKTNIAVNLSLGLCQQGYRVALIDVDMGLANADIILGIAPKYNLGHVFRGERLLKDIIVEGPLGIKLIAGGSGVTDLANLTGWRLDVFIKSLEELNKEFDFIILDTGAGIHRNVLSFVLATHEILVVTTPEPTAVTDVYGLLKVLHQHNPEAKVRLVVNMVKNPNEAEMVAEKLNAVLKEFVQWEIDYAGYILYESQISKAVSDQQPVILAFPSSMASRSFKRLANTISGENAQSESTGIKGFFSKVYEFLHI